MTPKIHPTILEMRLLNALALLSECVASWDTIEFDAESWEARAVELIEDCDFIRS